MNQSLTLSLFFSLSLSLFQSYLLHLLDNGTFAAFTSTCKHNVHIILDIHTHMLHTDNIQIVTVTIVYVYIDARSRTA